MFAEKTKILGKIHYDMRVEPVDKREEEQLLERRIYAEDNDRPGVQIITREETRKAAQSGSNKAAAYGENFIVSLRFVSDEHSHADPFSRKGLPRRNPPTRRRRQTRPRVSQKTSSWISCGLASGSIHTGL